MKSFSKKYYLNRFKKGHIPERTKESYEKQGEKQKVRFKTDKKYKDKLLNNVKKAQDARRGKPAWNSGKKDVRELVG